MAERFVKQLREHMTDAERVLWYRLRAHRLLGQKFRRQQPIGPYIADFVHFAARLIVEADGGQHNELHADAARDAWFEREGFRVLRFWNDEILGQTDAVLEQILRQVGTNLSSPNPASGHDHPCFPSPLAGEGGAAAPGEGFRAQDASRDRPHTPLPNPSPARGEGLGLARPEAPPASDQSLTKADTPSSHRHACFPSPLAGEGGAAAPGEGFRAQDASSDRPHTPLPNPSPARGEGLDLARPGSARATDKPLTKADTPSNHRDARFPSPLAAEGGAAAPGEGFRSQDASRDRPHTPLPNPSPARGEGLGLARPEAPPASDQSLTKADTPSSHRHACFPSPLAGEGGAAAPGEGFRAQDASSDRPHTPLPNPSPARGEGLDLARPGSARATDKPLTKADTPSNHRDARFPSPLAGEGGAAAPGEGCWSQDPSCDLPHTPLPNPSPARGEGLGPPRSDMPPDSDTLLTKTKTPPSHRDACLPSPLAGEGGAAAPGEGFRAQDASRDRPHTPLPNPSPARGEGLAIPHSGRGRANKATRINDLADCLSPCPSPRIVVGFSGGLDSTVLLHALAATPAAHGHRQRAIHVHHGLHPQADAWAAHCQQVCNALGVSLQIVRVRVDASSGKGPEAAARAARMAAFQQHVAHDEVLALAHHRDDQAETLLLRLLRSAGGDGLTAMRRRSRLGSLHLWRPLLALPRTQLQQWAEQHALDWIDDPSNADDRFDRNFIRHRVLPLLAERWPSASRCIARSAELLGEQSRLLDTVASAQLDRLLATPTTLSIAGICALQHPQRTRILRTWLRRLTAIAPPANVLHAIERNLLPARADAAARLDWAGLTLRAWRGHLHAGRPVAPWPANWQARWDGQHPLELPDGSRLELRGAAGLPAPVTVTARRGGERIRLPGREHHHTLKHVLQDRGVPPWIRPHLPLLFAADGELLAAGAEILSARLDAWLRGHGASLHLQAAVD